MKYYLIAGEASGDLHASNLMKGLLDADADAEFRFFGGDKMSALGGTLVKHYRDMAFMGIVDVLANLRSISRNLSLCKEDIRKWKPDVVILVDYAGFNLRIAEFAKTLGIKVFYYISPKVWVWKKSRIEKLKKFTDRLFVIFPFEPAFFKEHDMEVEYFGNPLMDAFSEYQKTALKREDFLEEKHLQDEPYIALLSGSRKDEVKRCLPEMVKASLAFPEYQFVVAGAPSISDDLYRKYLSNTKIRVLSGSTYDILNHAEAAVVTSGTATLETAIFKVPQVVIYKTSPVNYRIGMLFLKIKFFSLVNLIAGKEVVKELLQFDLAANVRTELTKILNNNDYRQGMLKSYEELHESIGGPGSSQRIAKRMNELLSQK